MRAGDGALQNLNVNVFGRAGGPRVSRGGQVGNPDMRSWWSPGGVDAQLRQGKLKGSDKVAHSNAENAEQHRSLLNITDAAASGGDNDKSAGEPKRDSQASAAGAAEDLSYAVCALCESV